MNPETLAIYAQDLSSYGIDDVAAVLEGIGKEAPQDFKQLWPAIGVITGAIGDIVRTRRVAEAMKERDRADVEYRARAIRELEEEKANPEEWNKTLDAAAERLGLERRRVVNTESVMQVCPHCSDELPVAPNIRFWTAQELRDYADVVEKNQQMATTNREADKVAREKAIETTAQMVADEAVGLQR